MKTFDPQDISTSELHALLLGAIAPRPIAFASTVDESGNVNLSPYSFFNIFGSNPPIVIFSPSRRVRGNTSKHTLENVLAVPEVVINIVNHRIVEQMSLSSTEYAKGVNEFIKAGLTQVPSTKIKPPRVGEAPAAFECIVKQVIETGTEGGAGNLIICEVIMAHFQDEIFDENGKIDPFKIDLVGRMGGDWYCRAQGEAIFQVAKPLRTLGIGVDQIPENIRLSHILTGNNLGKLGNVEQIPSPEDVKAFSENTAVQEILQKFQNQPEMLQTHLHLLAQKYLAENDILSAWKTLLQSEYLY